jgi:hypothetical protein
MLLEVRKTLKSYDEPIVLRDNVSPPDITNYYVTSKISKLLFGQNLTGIEKSVLLEPSLQQPVVIGI